MGGWNHVDYLLAPSDLVERVWATLEAQAEANTSDEDKEDPVVEIE